MPKQRGKATTHEPMANDELYIGGYHINPSALARAYAARV
jgi:hypothetical protein